MSVKKVLIIASLSLTLTACSTQAPTPEDTPETMIESTGDPINDSDSIQAELNNLDPSADFTPIKETDFTQ